MKDQDEKTYMIYAMPNFYEPDLAGNNQPYLLTIDGTAEPECFVAIQDAQDRIDELESDVYVTANGEAGRPEYVIVDHDPLEAYHDDRSYYNWDGCECLHDDGYCCGECSSCISWMIDKDGETVRAAAINA